MTIQKYCQIIFAFVILFFGVFWFLQGVGVLNVCPILCFSNCDCIEGGSQFWSILGGVVIVIGILIAIITMRHV